MACTGEASGATKFRFSGGTIRARIHFPPAPKREQLSLDTSNFLQRINGAVNVQGWAGSSFKKPQPLSVGSGREGSYEGKHRQKPSQGSALSLGIDYVPLNTIK